MPKLFQINTVVNTGSTGRITEDIGLIALSNNWESHIAYGRGKGVSKSNLYKMTFIDVFYIIIILIIALIQNLLECLMLPF